MFATLLGPLPRPALPETASARDLVRAAVDAQAAAGLEPVTDGGWWGERPAIDAWRETTTLTSLAVKQAITGPFSAGGDDPEAAARRLNLVLRDLADAGCPLIEVHEPAARDRRGSGGMGSVRPAAGDPGRRLRRDPSQPGDHRRCGGRGRIATVIAASYDSLAVDLIAGPENWRFVRASRHRGIICGALSPWSAGTTAPRRSSGPRPMPRRPRPWRRSRRPRRRRRPWRGFRGRRRPEARRLGPRWSSRRDPPEELRERLDPRSIDSRRRRSGTIDRPRAADGQTSVRRARRLDSGRDGATIHSYSPTSNPRPGIPPQEVRPVGEHISLTVNGTPTGAGRRAETAPRPGAPRGPGPDRHARRLRHEPVRRLHRPRRRPGREVVHDAGRPGRRRRRHHDRGHGHRRRACIRSRPRSGRSTASSAASARRA